MPFVERRDASSSPGFPFPAPSAPEAFSNSATNWEASATSRARMVSRSAIRFPCRLFRHYGVPFRTRVAHPSQSLELPLVWRPHDLFVDLLGAGRLVRKPQIGDHRGEFLPGLLVTPLVAFHHLVQLLGREDPELGRR